MATEARLDHLPPEPPDLRIGRLLSALHKSGPADHIGCQDGRSPPLNPLLSHGASELFWMGLH
jgi:hypothetical protein